MLRTIIPFLILLPVSCLAQLNSGDVRTVALSEFQMPEDVREQFKNSGCLNIAQSNLVSEQHNVLHGEFGASGQQDWMAICETGNRRVEARFIWGGQHRCIGSPFSDDMVLHLVVSRDILIVPYLQTASSSKGQDHERLLERWSAPGVLSYYCKDGKWEGTPGDTCYTNSLERHPSKTIGLSMEEIAARQDIEGLARTLLQEVVGDPSSTIKVSAVHGRCMPATSAVQTCYFQSVDDRSLDATATVEKIGSAWFATKARATVCRLQ